MDPSSGKQQQTQLAYNPVSSGSMAATVSSGFATVNSENTDPESAHQSDVYDRKSYLVHDHSQQHQFWNSRAVTSGVPLSTSAIHIKTSTSPRLDSQGIQLPSFMANSLYDATPKSSKPNYSGLLPPMEFSYKRTAEPLSGPLQYANYEQSSSLILASYQAKNAAASSASIQAYDQNHMPYDRQASSAKPAVQSSKTSDVLDTEAVKMLRLELSFKQQANEMLTQKLNILQEEQQQDSGQEQSENGMKLPKNYLQLFRDLMRTLNERTKELEETKLHIEAILVGLVMTKDTTITTHGTFDAQDLAHKITHKILLLQSENEALLNMVSHSNKQSLLVELGLLRTENKKLREKLEMTDN